MTFGHGRVEVLAALWSTLSIWLLTGLLVGEAIRRIKLYVDGNAENINGECTATRAHLVIQILFYRSDDVSSRSAWRADQRCLGASAG